MQAIIHLLSRLPLKTLYGMGDGIVYPLLYHVLRYRRAMVRKNLLCSFPEKTEQERMEMETQFYHHFADLIAEIIYGYGMSDEEMRERVVFDNPELVERLARERGGVFIMLAHLGNWEWYADLGKRYEDASITNYNVYRKLKSASFDRLMLAIRSKRGGGGCIEKNSLLRKLVSLRMGASSGSSSNSSSGSSSGSDNQPQRITIGLVADQKPSPANAHIWTDFLNQDTAFLDGAERLSGKFGYACVYAHVESKRRGYYRIHFEQLPDSTKGSVGDTTIAYAHCLERNIRECPHLWLWTHNRWKWSRDGSKNV